MRVLVTGGRQYSDPKFVDFVLNHIHAKKPISLIIHGCANGADTYAERWAAKTKGCTAYGVPANWKAHGERAGPVRNQLMLERGKPDLVVAFEGGEGTRSMTILATAASVKVIFAEKLRHHFEPMTVAERVKRETAANADARIADKYAPKTTGGKMVPSCGCEVLPWQDCAHTLAHNGS